MAGSRVPEGSAVRVRASVERRTWTWAASSSVAGRALHGLCVFATVGLPMPGMAGFVRDRRFPAGVGGGRCSFYRREIVTEVAKMLFRSLLRWIVRTLPRGTAATLAAVVVVGLAPVVASAAGTPPSNMSPPTISGHDVQGHLLLASPGVWSGTPPIGFAYQWLRCDQGGGSCSAIAGARFQSYRLTGADVGHTLRVTVTASNAYGTGTATSLATAVIQTAAPVNTSPPTISGKAQQGQTLTAAPGSWSGAQPMTFVFTWHRCDPSGSACVHIAGGTGPMHVVGSADVGHTLRVGVNATNRFGRGFARSAPTPVVVAVPETLTLTSRPRSVVYGRSVQLLGNVSPGQVGISVMIQAQRFGTRGSRRVATVSTAANGSFSAIVKPR